MYLSLDYGWYKYIFPLYTSSLQYTTVLVMSTLIDFEQTESEDDSPFLITEPPQSNPAPATKQNMTTDKIEELKLKVYIGDLHETFLRLPERLSRNTSSSTTATATATPQQNTSALPQPTPLSSGVQVPYPSQGVHAYPTQSSVPYPMQYHSPYDMNQITGYVGRLSIDIIQANLTKNYGFARMDPYCRLTIGQAVYETPTHLNGAKSPIWNKTVHCQLPQGIVNLIIEIFDEKSFTYDEKIAWVHLDIPPAVFQGTDTFEWFALSGRMGDAKEGMIHLGFKFQASTQPNLPQVYHPTNMPIATHQQRQILRQISVEQMKQLKDMFPNLEDEVVKSVLLSQGNDYEKTLSALLNMSND